jgi:uncharacterized protein (TIGR04255 family)
MTERKHYRPFTGERGIPVRLKDSPLALVLTQVRWPKLGFLTEEFEDRAKRLGVLLREFPLSGSSPEITLTVTPQGVTKSVTGTIFEWSSTDRNWTISLSDQAVTLICKDYQDFEDFQARLSAVLSKVIQELDVPLINRIGVRYVNVISQEDQVARISKLMGPETVGYLGRIPSTGEVEIIQTINQVTFRVGKNTVQSRSGLIPSGEILDSSLAPLEQDSWVLDIDAFAEMEMAFDLEQVIDQAGTLSDSAYDFFRWTITPEFITEFGG